MIFAGLVVIYLLAPLAKAANYFGLGPQWLRAFKLCKSTLY
jgi:hypothetical protein